MSDDGGLSFRVEWDEPGAVRTPELAATWCRLEVWSGSDCVSLVEEDETRASRRSIFVPLYPMAEWIAYNWWYLQRNHRPARVPTAHWTYNRLVQDRSLRNDWLRHHNLRAAGEGFPWPDLTFVPEGDYSRVTWRSSGKRVRGGLRYLSSGESLVPSFALQRALAGLVELTLTRLDEYGIKETSLGDEWKVLQSLDEEEVAYCEAAARLGLDAFQTSTSVSESLELAGKALKDGLLSDFLDAADPENMNPTLEWVIDASSQMQALTAPQETDLTELRRAVARNGDTPLLSSAPWNLGYTQAQAVRSAVGLDDLEPFQVERFVTEAVRPAPRREVDGYGEADDGVRVILGRDTAKPGQRFSAARALWHALDQPELPFLLTRARTTRQKVERAFAAELLAPAAGINALLADVGALWDPQDVEDIAGRYGVRSMLVQHQIENQLVF